MEYIEESDAWKKYKQTLGNEFKYWLQADKKNILRFILSLSISKHEGTLSFEDHKKLKEILDD